MKNILIALSNIIVIFLKVIFEHIKIDNNRNSLYWSIYCQDIYGANLGDLKKAIILK